MPFSQITKCKLGTPSKVSFVHRALQTVSKQLQIIMSFLNQHEEFCLGAVGS